MKKFRIDVFDCSFYVYRSDELARFNNDYGVDIGTQSHGVTVGNGVWIGDSSDDIVGVCYHEASHVVDWILETRLEMKQGDLLGNAELRAYLLEHIGGKIRKYCCDV